MSSDSDSDSGSDLDERVTIESDVVVTKYKMAGDIVNRTMAKVIERCVAGANVLDISELGDSLMDADFVKVFRKDKEIKKGIAFPTCISVNNCVCHFSPLKSDPGVLLVDGDLVKIDMGGHIDGFPAFLGHTLVVGANKENKVSGRKADAILAAYKALEAGLRLIAIGNSNTQVTEVFNKIAESYNCHAVEGMLSYNIEQHQMEGEKSVILNPSEPQKKDHAKCTFEKNEVWTVDVLISTGEGKTVKRDNRTTVYRRRDFRYELKMKASRQFFADVERKFALMAFTLRSFDDERKAKMGVVECVKHDLLVPYDVLWEREGELVAQFKTTLLLMPTGTLRITSAPFEAQQFVSEYSIVAPEVLSILAQPFSKKSKKKKKPKSAAAPAAGGEAPAAAKAGDS